MLMVLIDVHLFLCARLLSLECLPGDDRAISLMAFVDESLRSLKMRIGECDVHRLANTL